MANLNRVILAGNMTRPIETRNTNNGNTVGQFGLAINRKHNGQDTTLFVDVECWNKTAEFVAGYLGKGSGVIVDGRLAMDTWTDKDTGRNRTKMYVVAERVECTDKRPQPQQQQHPQQSPPAFPNGPQDQIQY